MLTRLKSIIPAISVISGYSYHTNKYCNGGRIATYSTLALAKFACDADVRCGSITDEDCDDADWITCSGSSLASSSQGSCSWVKPGKFCALSCLHIWL